jgi:FtsP/CotA-like multicopper oxidase with cupredoxin domain
MSGFTLSRRALLASAAASFAAPRFAFAAPMRLRAEPVSAQILPEGEGKTEMLGLNGATPGPILRVGQGARLEVRLENHIGDDTALHWHGIRIDNAMDGVPGMTQNAVPDGGSFDYSFVAPDAGTFWYHSHSRSWQQVEQGLYGALIVEEAEPPQVDHDVVVMIDDWRLDDGGALMGGFGNRHDFGHAGRLGNYARAIPSVAKVRRGDRLRLRLINAATARVFPLVLSGGAGKVVALDGMPLSQPRDMGAIVLAPAQRMDLIVDVTETVRFDFPAQDAPYALGRIEVEGENPSPIGGEIAPLPAPKVPKPGTPDHELEMTLEGGSMGGRHAGDDLWALNGQSGLSDTPFARFKHGETARIRLINDTAFPHGMHLHGHHFYQVTDGEPGDFLDTTLLDRGDTRDILCVFDNPGKWLLHCHMLGHQASGMKTWVEVV